MKARAKDERDSRTGPKGEEEEADPDGSAYVGEHTCKKCHFLLHRSWRRLPHAQALEALGPGEASARKHAAGLDPRDDFRTDTRCLRCHTTGFGKPGGHPTAPPAERSPEERERAKRHADVACEACRGPGSLCAEYKKDHPDYLRRRLAERGALLPIQEQHCRTCHRPACPTMPSGYVFDFEAAKRSDRLHVREPLEHAH